MKYFFVKFLQMKPLVKSRNVSYNELDYTVIKNFADKENQEKYEISDDFFLAL